MCGWKGLQNLALLTYLRTRNSPKNHDLFSSSLSRARHESESDMGSSLPSAPVSGHASGRKMEKRQRWDAVRSALLALSSASTARRSRLPPLFTSTPSVAVACGPDLPEARPGGCLSTETGSCGVHPCDSTSFSPEAESASSCGRAFRRDGLVAVHTELETAVVVPIPFG